MEIIKMDKTILLVDDNQMFIEIQKEFLQYTHLDILSAKDGLEALDLVRHKRPDLVFMDLEMPRMDGASCCRAIKSDVFSNIPVVMISSKENKDDCYLAGCDSFVTKPLNRDVFLDVARKFIPDLNRREKRSEINVDCILRLNDETITCHLKNVSMGGAFVVTDYFGIPNNVVQIHFTLPDDTLIDCSGRIAWMNRIEANHPKGIGVKFALMPKEAKSALKHFINSYCDK
jgi:CheY-like chemotaxis protein/Tfp pilus assembly protein PilZ